jgi:hypothetical protein
MTAAASVRLTKAGICRNRLVLTLVLHDIRWPRIKCFVVDRQKGRQIFAPASDHEIKRAGRKDAPFYQSKLEPNNGSGQRGVPLNHLVIPEGDANPVEKRALSLSLS